MKKTRAAESRAPSNSLVDVSSSRAEGTFRPFLTANVHFETSNHFLVYSFFFFRTSMVYRISLNVAKSWWGVRWTFSALKILLGNVISWKILALLHDFYLDRRILAHFSYVRARPILHFVCSFDRRQANECYKRVKLRRRRAFFGDINGVSCCSTLSMNFRVFCLFRLSIPCLLLLLLINI